jgi:UDP-glucuronate 4-epimerase
LIDRPPEEGLPVTAVDAVDSLSPVAPWRTVNIAGGQPVGLMEFIDSIENSLGVAAKKLFLPIQKGEVSVTYADSKLLKALTGFEPAISINEGVKAFVDWHREYRHA